jgi:hypothetical protein
MTVSRSVEDLAFGAAALFVGFGLYERVAHPVPPASPSAAAGQPGLAACAQSLLSGDTYTFGECAKDLTGAALQKLVGFLEGGGWAVVAVYIGGRLAYQIINKAGDVVGYFYRAVNGRWNFRRRPPGGPPSGAVASAPSPVPSPSPAPSRPSVAPSQAQPPGVQAAALVAQMKAEAESGAAWTTQQLRSLGHFLNTGAISPVALVGGLGLYAVQLAPQLPKLGLTAITYAGLIATLLASGAVAALV